MFHGFGKKTNPDGSYYEGEFKDDSATGVGKHVKKNGTEAIGEWKDGKLVKRMTEREFKHLKMEAAGDNND